MGNNPLHIIIESHIPFIKGLLEPYATVTYLPQDDITPEAVRDADAIFVRTRNRCDARLLEGSRVQFVATATIGTDHIDLPWCASHGITVANAAGCNAPAVAQYVLSSVLHLANRPVEQYTIGIVGVGHVGSIVERWARGLQMNVMLCDPPRQKAEGGSGWSTLSDIARRADIITFHTPLTPDTRHMIDAGFLNALQRHPIIINSARGPVADTPALIEALRSGTVHHAITDCWEGEPEISRQLLALSAIATTHIAGYSIEGKKRATCMVLDAFCRHFGLPEITIAGGMPAPAPGTVSASSLIASFDPESLTAQLKSHPEDFETIRNTYPLRYEPHAGKID